MSRRRLVPSFAAPTEAPISDLNTTPLIDVMLVLLIMFILTVPLATHKVPLDLPVGTPTPGEPAVHRLSLDEAGRLSWEGAPTSLERLPAQLSGMGPDDELHLRAEPQTPYDAFDHTMAAVKRAGVVRLGLIDNDRFRNF